MSRLRLFTETALGAFRPRHVQYLIFFVTSRCNARCRMCFNWRALDESKGEGDLGLEEIRAVSRSLPGLIHLTLSGGEPFLRDDLVEIVETFHQHGGIKQLTIPTNGILSEKISEIFPDLLRRFPDLSINLDLSIDATGQEHDEIRGVPGAYERAVETYKRAREWKTRHPRLRLGVSAVMSSFNQDKIIDLLDHLDREFGLDRREVMLARGSTREPAASRVSIDTYERAHGWIKDHDRGIGSGFFSRFNCQLAVMMREALIRTVREDRMIVPCLAGSKMAIIEAGGTVRPCEMLHVLYPGGLPEKGLEDFVLGRAHDVDYDIARIIKSEKAERVRRFIRDSRCYCTFECALMNNLVFNPRYWPGLLFRTILNP